jgi:DeoR family fructose operon transcriptional repressor
MLYEKERKLKIVEYIEEHKRASVQKLSEVFKVSLSTVRRDLSDLEKENLLKRSHGGAISLSRVNFETDFELREDDFKDEKKLIAKKAVEFIDRGDTILIDSGTTTFYMANELKELEDITIVTNSLILANKLQLNKSIEIILVGGNLRVGTKSLVGPIANSNFDRFKVDKGFIATNCIDFKSGLTTPNIMEASTKEKMIEISKEVYLLADSSKYGKVNFAKFADIKDIDIFITDSGLKEEYEKFLKEKKLNSYIL